MIQTRFEYDSLYFEICLGFEFWDLGFIWKLEFEIWDLCDYILEKKVRLIQSEFYKLHTGLNTRTVAYLSLSSYDRTILTG